MDDTLKTEIADAFHAEYLAREQSRKTGFFKILDNVNDKMDAFFNKAGLNANGVTLLGSVALLGIAPPVGLAAIGTWVVHSGLTIYSSIQDNARASMAVARDIDNGLLPERYNDVLDERITKLGADIELTKAKKSALPPKGAAAAAFAEALAASPVQPDKKPAPAPKPQNTPRA
ncbi:MAG: hypothetical protein PW788_05205 [Micavibrio sp.]|nr:hypothetical protein [Micavibrio sp.]